MKNGLKEILKFVSIRLHIATLIIDEDMHNLQEFEKTHCIMPKIQKVFSVEYLETFLKNAKKDLIYHIEDVFKLHIVIMNIDDTWCLVGPYAEANWDDTQFEIALSSLNIPAAYMFSYKTYRYKYTALSTRTVISYVQQIRFSLINSFIESQIEHITDESNATLPQTHSSNEFEVRVVLRRYEYENKLIHAIKKGSAQEAIQSYRSIPIPLQISDIYTKSRSIQFTNFSIIKTLVRKAAEEAGVDVLRVNAISEEYSQKMRQSIDSNTLMSLIVKMLTDFCDAVNEVKDLNYSPSVSIAVNYIDNALSQEIILSNIAKQVNLSEAHLSRLFKKETGVTTSQYIINKRTHKAAELLRTTKLPVQNICIYVGYPDSNYFVKVFKKIYGMTPTDYRKKKPTY